MSAYMALHISNKAIVDHKDVTEPPLVLSWTTTANNLILTTAIHLPAIDCKQHLSILKGVLVEAKAASAKVNACWTKFLLHDEPTDATVDEVRYQIETNYPLFKIGQTSVTSPKK